MAVRASPKGRDLGLALACHPEERSDRVASPEGAKDLGFEWGHDQKRDPSGGEAYPQDDTQKQSF